MFQPYTNETILFQQIPRLTEILRTTSPKTKKADHTYARRRSTRLSEEPVAKDQAKITTQNAKARQNAAILAHFLRPGMRSHQENPTAFQIREAASKKSYRRGICAGYKLGIAFSPALQRSHKAYPRSKEKESKSFRWWFPAGGGRRREREDR